ncbi:hypothetical protein D1007_24585 [Hordeum vulgare]|nr:hypothetical protein D1007_24585 [Hordeum vulgare]
MADSTQCGSSTVGLAGLDDGVVSVGVVVVAVDAAVAAGTGIWFNMRPRSTKYHAFTCSSIVNVCAPIKNARAVFLFFTMTLVLRKSSLTCWFALSRASGTSLDFSHDSILENT